MIKKDQEKKDAIKLRKSGYTYSEILEKIPVAKSTLSAWLKNLGIAKKQQQKFTLKRKLAQLKAQEVCRQNRIDRENIIVNKARKEVADISKKDLWMIGTILYWAEGCKQKINNVSQRVSFGNYDPKMMLLFNRWLKEICKCSESDLFYCIYIHRTADKEKARKYWEKLLNIRVEKIYFKNHNPKTNRKNVNENYHGLFRIDVRKSTDLNRRIAGWILGITEKLNII